MTPFEFFAPHRIVFGRGSIGRLGELAAALGRRAIVIHNGELSAAATQSLQAASVQYETLRQRGEPKVQDVDAGLALARSGNCELVIGLGGGSAIDAAKAVAGLLANGGVALDYMEVVGRGQKLTKPAAPWIAIPTTAGTGAEATRNAVIGYPAKQFKASIRSEGLLPRIALIDPELAVGVPADVTARSGMDALCQLIEAYTSTHANPMTDALALAGIALAAEALPRAYRNGGDLDAREAMAVAALYSGLALTSAGLGAVHGFAAPLGAMFDAPHGAVCAALLPPVLEANVRELMKLDANHATLDRYARVAQLLGSATAHEAAARLVQALRIPPLRQWGVSESSIDELVRLARKSSSMKFNPVVLGDDVLAEILRRAL